MEPPKDKRTKAYKEWKKAFDAEQSNKPQGLGDTVEKITKATGIKKAVEWIAGEDCGCDERKEKLNKLFVYHRLQCPTESQFYFMQSFFRSGRTPSQVTSDQQRQINLTLNHVKGTKLKATNCSSCLKNRINDLKNIYDTYK